MDAWHGVLVAGVLGFGAAAVWLAMWLSRVGTELGAAQAEVERLRPVLGRVEGAEARARELHVEAARLQERLEKTAEVGREREAAAARREAELKASIEDLTGKFKEVFGRLSADALRQASADFLKLAEAKLGEKTETAKGEMDKRKAAVDELIRPMAEALRRTDERLTGLSAASEGLKSETVRLVRALSKPEVRGRYGEIQLERVAELAGMKPYCDFASQESQRDGEGRLLRPDMTVKLPNDRRLVVDAKTNTHAYLEAVNARDDAERESWLDRYAEHVADQVTALSRKSYWSNDPGAYDFIVMFVPGDQFLDAALARRPDLIERAAEQNVIIASPATLIGLLRAVAVGWREKRIEEQARELLELGRELHERAAVAFEHVAELGASIEQSVNRYNKVVGSIESRVLPTLRKFEESGAASAKQLVEIKEVGALVRQPMLLPEVG